MTNLSRWLRFHALRTPRAPAIWYDGETVDHAELWRRVGAVAQLIKSEDIVAGDRVALLMRNSAAFIEIAFAVSHVGAVLVPINFRLSPAEVSYILADSGARLLFVDEELADAAIEAPRRIGLDRVAQCDSSVLSQAAPAPAPAPVSGDDLCRIMYTSGTTDHPKGVTHSYANIHAKAADHVTVLGITAATKLLVAGPLYHVGAFDLPGVAVLMAGGALAVHRDFVPSAILDSIASHRLDGAWLAPVMTSALLEHGGGDRDLSSLRWVVGGGERTPESRIRAFTTLFPAARYIDAYGLTETCGGDTFMEPGREIEKIGSTGRPVPQIEIEIRDDEGRALEAGEEGEICLRGPKVTRGYWNALDKTRASFFGDWLRTGDMGYLDAEGFLFLTDRKKDMIISGGENIASSELERAILELPEIGEVAVIGIPDEKWGERPLAAVVARGGHCVDEQQVRAHCRARLAAFKVPDRVVILETLPRNASGKILKRSLRDQLCGSAMP